MEGKKKNRGFYLDTRISYWDKEGDLVGEKRSLFLLGALPPPPRVVAISSCQSLSLEVLPVIGTL